MADKGKGPLRQWTEQSYGVDNGRAVSSIEESGNMGNHAKGSGRQCPTEGYHDKSGSADGARNKRAGSKL